jgi:hypothetical protein
LAIAEALFCYKKAWRGKKKSGVKKFFKKNKKN